LDYTDTLLKELEEQKDSYKHFDDFELSYYLWAREYLGKFVDFLTEEQKQKIREADKVALRLAEEVKDEIYTPVFKRTKEIIERYPV